MTNQLFDLKGRVAIVTGGNAGIGLAMARGLAEAGAAITIADRNADNSAQARASLERDGHQILACVTDVTNPASVAQMVASTRERFGRIDILVNNAGISIAAPLEEMSLGNWQTVIDVNMTAPFICAQAVYPEMKAAGSGKIINIASVLAQLGSGGAANYAASKGGILQFTRSLATAWAVDNIQSNAILPGWIDTDLTIRARERVPELHDRIVSRVPAARWGRPDDLVGATVFLASAASDFVNGAALTVDGGFSIQG
ncbi:glucose 1-dehydrogenase [Tardiphaga alba]|uniref:Glucose 1-dehydrogenase n=1 Tax=Tardiphaga alba TaxID=340268 RepID=A0ABX8ABU2_9BRAD|nr:glucose 1-dehydrogenase [Tardiphaga alba]QUS39865.1 glucose 1-dehydrogenase [Tardiphaga alba]